MPPPSPASDLAAGLAAPSDSDRKRWRTACLRLLRMHYEARVGHIGGNLSALDVLLTLHHDVLGPDDQFILSKGHAAGALYVTLWSQGRLSDDDLTRFHQDNTLLSGHPPPRGLERVLFATGSLGHGLGIAAGLAMSKRLQRQPGRVYCLLSDGEWNEGSNWESLIFAAHHRLSELTLIVDLNGWQGFGRTSEVADLGDLTRKLASFHVETREVDGHNSEALRRALSHLPDGRPLCVVARTIKGHGVSFMEDRMEWHYLPMTEEQYRQALDEVSVS